MSCLSRLKPEFNWFLSEEFNQIREDFEPADYHKYLKEDVASEMADQQTPSLSNSTTPVSFLPTN